MIFTSSRKFLLISTELSRSSWGAQFMVVAWIKAFMFSQCSKYVHSLAAFSSLHLIASYSGPSTSLEENVNKIHCWSEGWILTRIYRFYGCTSYLRGMIYIISNDVTNMCITTICKSKSWLAVTAFNIRLSYNMTIPTFFIHTVKGPSLFHQ